MRLSSRRTPSLRPVVQTHAQTVGQNEDLEFRDCRAWSYSFTKHNWKIHRPSCRVMVSQMKYTGAMGLAQICTGFPEAPHSALEQRKRPPSVLPTWGAHRSTSQAHGLNSSSFWAVSIRNTLDSSCSVASFYARHNSWVANASGENESISSFILRHHKMRSWTVEELRMGKLGPCKEHKDLRLPHPALCHHWDASLSLS